MRLVDVDDLKVDMIIEQRDFMSCGVHLDYASVRGVTLSQILTAPSIDIVRCKECKKSHIDGKTTHYLWCTEWGRSADTFGYCERGER